jgi:hypothetical protein
MRQAMYCHACGHDFSADMNMQADGNHVFDCPHCKHEHCRVVRGGVITGDRWDRRNGMLGAMYYATSSASTGGLSASNNIFLYDSWNSTSTATAYY